MPDASARDVVIADNNEFYRQVLGDFYREWGFRARIARDGIEALELIQSAAPDLVILDLIMPRIDGARLCSLLKHDDRLRAVPVIILSGILVDEIEAVESIPADAFIAKMPLEQVRDALRAVTAALLAGEGPRPLQRGFEKMDRREVVLELLQERRTGKETLDSLSEGIAELTADHRILTTNRALESIAGRAGAALISRRFEDLFPAGAAVLRDLFSDVERGAPAAATSIRHGGRVLQVKLHRCEPDAEAARRGGLMAAVLRAAAGESPKVRLQSMMEAVGYTVLVEDITERVQAEQERERLRQRLAHSEKMSAIGLFVSGAAHELNNPLTSVLGYVQLLLQKGRAAGAQRELEKVLEGAARCRTIVDNLMTFSRSVRPEKGFLDLNALLVEIVGGRQERLRAEGIELITDLSPDLPAVPADAAQLHHAIDAVLDNAVKALASVTGGRKELAVTSRLQRGRVRIEVSDTGPGIPADVLPRVFDPFFTTRPVGKGAGLGLSAAHGVAASHGGRIRAENRPEGGARVILELPLDRPEPAAAAVASSPAAEARERRILIVDDEAVVVELLMDILEEHQHHIDTAANGYEGLRKLEVGRYDLIILDLRMPDMTGRQMYEELVSRHPGMLDRLIFITADTATLDVAEFLERTGHPCLTKPFAIQSVVETVQSILAREAPPRA